jgi:hypothetical protein
LRRRGVVVVVVVVSSKNTTNARNDVEVPYLGCTHIFVPTSSYKYMPVVLAALVMDTRNDDDSSNDADDVTISGT